MSAPHWLAEGSPQACCQAKLGQDTIADSYFVPYFVEFVAWFRHFYLFKTIRHKDGHFFSIKSSWHTISFR